MELVDGQVKSMTLEQGESHQHLDKLYNKGRMSVKTQNRSQNGMTQSHNQMLRKSCFRCGRKHDPEKCPAKEWECFNCKKRGHTSRVCRGSSVHYMGEDGQEGEQESYNEEDDEDSLLLLGFLSSLEHRRENPLQVCLDIEDSIKSDKSTSVLSDVDLSAQISNTTSDTVNGKQGTQCVSDSIPQNMSPNTSRELDATHGVHLEDNDSGSANLHTICVYHTFRATVIGGSKSVTKNCMSFILQAIVKIRFPVYSGWYTDGAFRVVRERHRQ
nr:unnamed protein product [Callosobruchus analis]